MSREKKGFSLGCISGNSKKQDSTFMTYDDHVLSGLFQILLAATVVIRAAESRRDFALAAAKNEGNCIYSRHRDTQPSERL